LPPIFWRVIRLWDSNTPNETKKNQEQSLEGRSSERKERVQRWMTVFTCRTYRWRGFSGTGCVVALAHAFDRLEPAGQTKHAQLSREYSSVAVRTVSCPAHQEALPASSHFSACSICCKPEPSVQIQDRIISGVQIVGIVKSLYYDTVCSAERIVIPMVLLYQESRVR